MEVGAVRRIGVRMRGLFMICMLCQIIMGRWEEGIIRLIARTLSMENGMSLMTAGWQRLVRVKWFQAMPMFSFTGEDNDLD